MFNVLKWWQYSELQAWPPKFLFFWRVLHSNQGLFGGYVQFLEFNLDRACRGNAQSSSKGSLVPGESSCMEWCWYLTTWEWSSESLAYIV